MAALPPKLMVLSLPPPTATVPLTDILAAAPNTGVYTQQASFVFAFIGATPMTQLVPSKDLNLLMPDNGGDPDYQKDTPFNQRVLVHATVKFRVDWSTLIRSWTNPIIRMAKTNFGWPTWQPSMIEI